jgi:diamine N-acetyltransferase
MQGTKVFLRPTTATDMANMYPWTLASDPQSMSCRPRPMKTSEELVNDFKNRKLTDNRQPLTIVRSKDMAVIGLTSFFDLNTLNRSAELGLRIDPDEQQKGYGADAMKVLVRYLFKYRGLNKVYAQTAGFNAGAVALLEKLAFHRDAVLRDHYFYDGAFHPGFVYSLLLYELDW